MSAPLPGPMPDVFRRFLGSLACRRLTEDDRDDISALCSFDPWHTSPEATIEQMREGWRCYVATTAGRIIASSSAIAAPTVRDPFLRRTLALAPGEAYTGRTFCAPAYRGRGVSPWLAGQIIAELRQTQDTTQFYGLVRKNNFPQLRSLASMGWAAVGSLGFIDVPGLRVHYIRGRRALPAERRRLFVRRHGASF